MTQIMHGATKALILLEVLHTCTYIMGGLDIFHSCETMWLNYIRTFMQARGTYIHIEEKLLCENNKISKLES